MCNVACLARLRDDVAWLLGRCTGPLHWAAVVPPGLGPRPRASGLAAPQRRGPGAGPLAGRPAGVEYFVRVRGWGWGSWVVGPGQGRTQSSWAALPSLCAKEHTAFDTSVSVNFATRLVGRVAAATAAKPARWVKVGRFGFTWPVARVKIILA